MSTVTSSDIFVRIGSPISGVRQISKLQKMEKIKDDVSNGITYLDRFAPKLNWYSRRKNWHKRIDKSSVMFLDSGFVMLIMIFMGEENIPKGAELNGSNLGFSIPDHLSADDAEEYRNNLEDEWKRRLSERQL